MPMHRRRVYVEHGASRRARLEAWLSLSIVVSALILILSLLGCLPDLISMLRSWLLPERLPARFQPTPLKSPSAWIEPCEMLLTISGAYLIFAVFLKSHTRRRLQ